MGFKENFVKHLPTILTVAGCLGIGGTVFFAVKVTPEAQRRVQKLKDEKNLEISKLCEKQYLAEHKDETDEAQIFVGTQELMDRVPDKEYRPAFKDVVKEIAPLYIPAVLMGGASVAAFIGANSISVQRLTATSAALTATEEAFRTYKNKVVEQIGEKKAAEVIKKIAEEKVEKNPPVTESNPNGAPIIITGAGDALCYDSYTGRYFKSDIDKIHRIVNNLNERLLHEDYISLNDFYYELGLPQVTMGEQLGWNSMTGLIDLTFSSILADEEHGGGPCLVIDYLVGPRYQYGDLHRW